jgi:cation:H+ antiporter
MIVIILWISLFIVGYLMIFFSADVFLDNLKELCIIYGISPFIIGLLIIGIDPEESIASIVAAFNDLSYIAVGNVIGNSIVALTISFAIPAFFYQISIESIHQFYFSLLYICLILILIGTLIKFGLFIIGIIVIIIYFIYIFRNIKLISKDIEESPPAVELAISDKDRTAITKDSRLKKVAYIFISFVFIFLGGEFLIISTRQIIIVTNIPETFFGLVIIAFVTNVEEITLVLKSIKKKSVEIGLGGMIGKVFWNITITFGISAIIIISFRPLWVIFWNWLILLIVIIYFNLIAKKKIMNWNDGILLMVILIAFLILNFLFI